jgi:prevent-host-death family protein
MKVANLAEVKNELSRFVALVRRGTRVRILVHGVPAADLVPIDTLGEAKDGDELELNELERQGIVRRGVSRLTPREQRELDRPGPRVRDGRAVQALVAERRSGR